MSGTIGRARLFAAVGLLFGAAAALPVVARAQTVDVGSTVDGGTVELLLDSNSVDFGEL